MPSSHLGLGLALSLVLHLALLVTPWSLLPWESEPKEIEARLLLQAPAPRPPQPVPARPAKKRIPIERGPTPVLPQLPLLEDALSPPPSPPGLPAAPVAQAPTAGAAPAIRAVAAAAAPAGTALPRSGRIQFAVNRGDQGFVIGRAVHRWRQDGARYQIESLTETTGLAAIFRPVTMVQKSEGDIVAATLQPREYRNERDGRLVEAASFDWAGQRLSYTGGRSATLVAGSQDMLSAFYQLGRQGPEGGVELALTTGKKYETYRFVALGEETLNLRFGEVRTIRLKSGGEPGSDATEVWLAPALYGLPMKIRYTDRNGDAFDQTAEEIEIDQEPGTGTP